MTHDEIETEVARLSEVFSDDVVERFREEISMGAQSISLSISNNLLFLYVDTGQVVEFTVDGVPKDLFRALA